MQRLEHIEQLVPIPEQKTDIATGEFEDVVVASASPQTTAQRRSGYDGLPAGVEDLSFNRRAGFVRANEYPILRWTLDDALETRSLLHAREAPLAFCFNELPQELQREAIPVLGRKKAPAYLSARVAATEGLSPADITALSLDGFERLSVADYIRALPSHLRKLVERELVDSVLRSAEDRINRRVRRLTKLGFLEEVEQRGIPVTAIRNKRLRKVGRVSEPRRRGPLPRTMHLTRDGYKLITAQLGLEAQDVPKFSGLQRGGTHQVLHTIGLIEFRICLAALEELGLLDVLDWHPEYTWFDDAKRADCLLCVSPNERPELAVAELCVEIDRATKTVARVIPRGTKKSSWLLHDFVQYHELAFRLGRPLNLLYVVPSTANHRAKTQAEHYKWMLAQTRKASDPAHNRQTKALIEAGRLKREPMMTPEPRSESEPKSEWAPVRMLDIAEPTPMNVAVALLSVVGVPVSDRVADGGER